MNFLLLAAALSEFWSVRTRARDSATLSLQTGASLAALQAPDFKDKTLQWMYTRVCCRVECVYSYRLPSEAATSANMIEARALFMHRSRIDLCQRLGVQIHGISLDCSSRLPSTPNSVGTDIQSKNRKLPFKCLQPYPHRIASVQYSRKYGTMNKRHCVSLSCSCTVTPGVFRRRMARLPE
jgi:hypothetical protein